MKISLNVDTSRWLGLPRVDADSSEAVAWADDVIAGMKSAWGDKLSSQTEPVVREALRHGLRQISENDSVTLQFWPNTTIANAVVHISASPFADGEKPQALPGVELDYVGQPVVELFGTDNLGMGTETRYLIEVGSAPSVRLGGVHYVFQNDYGFIAVLVEPTLPELIGVMLESLRDVVRTIRVIDDAAGDWSPATVDEAALPSRGEAWLASETAGEAEVTAP